MSVKCFTKKRCKWLVVALNVALQMRCLKSEGVSHPVLCNQIDSTALKLSNTCIDRSSGCAGMLTLSHLFFILLCEQTLSKR